MPLFLATLITAIGRAITGFQLYHAFRITAAVSGLVFYTSLTLGLGVAAATAIGTALEALPGAIGVGASWIIPARFPQLLGIWLSVQAAAVAYKVAMKASAYNPFRGVGG